jgi:hypothetical protein
MKPRCGNTVGFFYWFSMISVLIKVGSINPPKWGMYFQLVGTMIVAASEA